MNDYLGRNSSHHTISEGYFANPPGTQSSTGGEMRKMMAKVGRNVWLVILVTILTTSPVYYLVSREIPRYRAESLIRLVDGRAAMTGLAETSASLPGSKADAILSQLEVLRGRNVLGQVVDREGLRLKATTNNLPPGFLSNVTVSSAALSQPLRLEINNGKITAISEGNRVTTGVGDEIAINGVRFKLDADPGVAFVDLEIIPRDVAIDDLRGSLNAYSLQSTDAVAVEYLHHDPIVAQRVVNSIVSVFQQSNARVAQQQSQRRRVFLEQQLQTTDSMMADIQYAMAAFRTRTQVVGSRERQVAQQQGLMDLELRSQELKVERQTYLQLLSLLDRQIEPERSVTLRTLVATPGMASNSVVMRLYSQLSEYERDRDAMTVGTRGSTSAHPDVQRLSGLIAGTQNSLIDAAKSHVFLLESRIEALSDLSQRNRSELDRLPQAEAEELRLIQNLETVSRMADHLRQEVQKARMAEAVEAGQVEIVHLAPRPLSPISSRKSLKLGAAILLGLILGVAGVFARESMKTSFHDTEDLKTTLMVRSLAVIPRLEVSSELPGSRRLLRRRNKLGSTDAVSLLKSHGIDLYNTPASMNYRMLHNNIVFGDSKREIKVLSVTSAAPGEGKTTTCVNLAVVYAQQGNRVLIIDCDLIRARVHSIFGMPREPGVSDLLARRSNYWNTVHETPVEGIHLIPGGRPLEIQSSSINAKYIKELIEISRCDFDVIIVDTPPLLASPDATTLCSMVDGVLLVVRAGATDRSDASYAVEQLRLTGANVLGAVFNDPASISSEYSNYYSYYRQLD
jgi:polysaccharide biosynthesis transport protein